MDWEPKIGDWVTVKLMPGSLYEVRHVPVKGVFPGRYFGAGVNVSLWVHECRPATEAEVAAKVARRIAAPLTFDLEQEAERLGDWAASRIGKRESA